MKRQVAIYIEGKRIELFDDEKIGINSSIQNIQDVSKVFTDFSQSFSVPCSNVNNPIFEHYYESSVSGFINHNLRRNAWIEIDATFFRSGKIQLEGVQLKNNKPYAYKITFYGDIRKLKDRFGEEKLKDLDFSAYSHEYTGTEVLNRIRYSTNYDIRYPLISSQRVWQWNEPSTPADNIDTAGGAINYLELFPALKNRRIFDIIQAHYGISFQGTFLGTTLFDRSFLHLKNKATAQQYTNPQDIDFNDIYEMYNNNLTLANYVDLSSNSIHLVYNPNVSPTGTQPIHRIRFFVMAVSAVTTYYIEIYQNGVLSNTVVNNDTGQKWIGEFDNTAGLDIYFTFKVYASTAVTLDFEIQYEMNYVLYNSSGVPTYYGDDLYIYCNDVTLTSFLNISNNMPDIKVADYFAGILKEFNLTCYPINENVFQIEPLEDWYSKGRIIDITPYVDIETIEVSKVPLYKKIEFVHEKSESFMNRQFNEFFAREYGDLLNVYPYDGGDYSIKVPFEQPLFNKFSGVNLQVGYYLKPAPNYEPYIPKPVILYYNNISSQGFYLNDGTGAVWTNTHAVFGQDTSSNGLQYSLNFGQEISSYYLTPITRGLYDVYYRPYIENMFNLQNRLTEVKCILPLRILTDLKLNDRVIIRDKRYIINEMKSELTSGEVNLSLLNDFRSIRKKKPIFKPISDIIKYTILLKNKQVKATVDTSSSTVTVDIPLMTKDTEVTFTIPTNPIPVLDLVSEDEIVNIVTENREYYIVMEPYQEITDSVFIEFESENGDIEIDELIFTR